jgi:Putative DNA-binding domain
MGNRSLGELAERLERERCVWVRLVADRAEANWRLTAMEVTMGAPPPSWRRVRWCYPKAMLIAAAPAGKTVARWLTRARISLRPISVELALDDSVLVERRPSRFVGFFEPLPWPNHEWTIGVRRDATHAVNEELIAADAPAFLSIEQAVAAFFGLPKAANRTFSRRELVSGRELIVREQDQRARIDHVRVRPKEVLATISGTALHGSRLTLGGVDMPTKTLSSRSTTVRLSTPDGLGSGAWLALHRDEELLDRRPLDANWRSKEFDIEHDFMTQAEVLISGGEGLTTEFKQQLPGKDPEVVMKTIAAFANRDGGVILFGVTDEGQPVGLGSDNSRGDIDRLTSLINDWIRPRVEVHLSEVTIGAARLILLAIAPGMNPPYGVGTSNKRITYYIRVGATSTPASPEDIQALVRGRLPALV